MKREEATDLLREIMKHCDGISEEGVMLMPPDSNGVLSHGYQLHIKSAANQINLPCFRPLIEKRHLALSFEPTKGNLLVIYKPMKKQKVA